MFLHGAIRELTSGGGSVVKPFNDLASMLLLSRRSSNTVEAANTA